MTDRDPPPDGDAPDDDPTPLPPEAEQPEADDDDLDPASRGWILRSIAVVAIIGLIALFVARPAQRGAAPPEFQLPLLDGSGTLSSAALEGRAVVLNFWASWCGPCREEAPLLERKWQEYRGEGLVVVGVNVQDRPEDARRFASELGLSFPIVTDYDRLLSRDLQVFGLPQTFFIDPEWRFHGEFAGGTEGRETPSGPLGAPRGVAVLGAISEEDLDRSIREMLGLR